MNTKLFVGNLSYNVTENDLQDLFAQHGTVTDVNLMLDRMNYALSDEAADALREYIALRKTQPHFANARSIRNALDRARLRQANRLFLRAMQGQPGVSAAELSTLTAEDIRASRVFTGGLSQ